MKQCSKCFTTKPLAEFSKHAKAEDGCQPWCKQCCSKHRAARLQEPEYREQRNSEIREYHRGSLLSRLRNTMRGLIRRVSPTTKNFPSKKILGYSAKDLCAHLEAQFEPGMSWHNRSAWHIDHIKPVSAFIQEGITDPKIVNALSNLRPLWAKDNFAKGDK